MVGKSVSETYIERLHREATKLRAQLTEQQERTARAEAALEENKVDAERFRILVDSDKWCQVTTEKGTHFVYEDVFGYSYTSTKLSDVADALQPLKPLFTETENKVKQT